MNKPQITEMANSIAMDAIALRIRTDHLIEKIELFAAEQAGTDDSLDLVCSTVTCALETQRSMLCAHTRLFCAVAGISDMEV